MMSALGSDVTLGHALRPYPAVAMQEGFLVLNERVST